MIGFTGYITLCSRDESGMFYGSDKAAARPPQLGVCIREKSVDANPNTVLSSPLLCCCPTAHVTITTCLLKQTFSGGNPTMYNNIPINGQARGTRTSILNNKTKTNKAS